MTLQETFTSVREAQKKYSGFSQEQVDKIFREAALAANHARIPLAKLAVQETGMGIEEDKVIKNHFASEYIYNAYKNSKTCGVIAENTSFGTVRIAEPVGVIGGVIPTTNPTSTVIFKALIALKTRNAIIFSPHPRAKHCTIAAAKLVLDAAVKAGAPKNIIAWIENPTLEDTQELMRSADLILATGGPGMVKAAYSSGTPAVGVGSGNTPVIIDKSADIQLAVSSILVSKTFDNGMICASEQSVIVHSEIYKKVKEEFALRGAYILNNKEIQKVRSIILNEKGALNADIVGQRAHTIAKMAGIDVPEEAKVLIGEVESTDLSEPFAHEKLSPVLAMYQASSFDNALAKAEILVKQGGPGHTCGLYIDDIKEKETVARFARTMKTGRILINSPSSHGGIGDLYNFDIAPSLTLGCGSWGGNSVSENVGIKHLLNIKTVAKRRDNMLWFKIPQKVYFKFGCLPIALKELAGKKRAVIVTDKQLAQLGYTDHITKVLEDLHIQYRIYSDVEADPTLAIVRQGAKMLLEFEPDVIIALGGGSAIDAAKIMRVLYEYPNTNFIDLAMTFMDIRKRIVDFPKLGIKAGLWCVATSAGTGSEVTPFAVITDEQSGIKYPLADYELTADVAIVDPELMLSMPMGLTAASGIDVLTHAIEAYVSIMATEYTSPLALEAIRLVFDNLEKSVKEGANAIYEKERMANASCLAGMAFANAFLGVCHSMAHKLGSNFHLPHGIANALMLEESIRFNATDKPNKMAAFSQYDHPNASERYAKISELMGLCAVKDSTEQKIEALIKRINELKTNIGIKASISEYDIKEETFLAKLDKMVEEAFNDQCTGANPRYPLMSEIKQMYLNAYYGEKK